MPLSVVREQHPRPKSFISVSYWIPYKFLLKISYTKLAGAHPARPSKTLLSSAWSTHVYYCVQMRVQRAHLKICVKEMLCSMICTGKMERKSAFCTFIIRKCSWSRAPCAHAWRRAWTSARAPDGVRGCMPEQQRFRVGNLFLMHDWFRACLLNWFLMRVACSTRRVARSVVHD